MLQTKALYNLLRLNSKEDPSIKAPPWALEDWREVSLDTLWKKLAKLKIPLDPARFKQFAEECDSPEMLTDLLLDETESEHHDQIYLLLFELWRRFFPEKASLSIFCDELDFQIDLYDKNELETDEPLQDGLANLSEILDEHVDEGMSQKEAFSAVSEYFANDLTTFLYDYITDLLDQDNLLYASELLEEFSPYMQDPLRFDLLTARVVSATDTVQANELLKTLLDNPLEPDLLFDLLRLLAAIGNHNLFQTAIKKLLPYVKEKEDIEEVIDLAIEYYRRLDLDKLEQAVIQIKNKKPLDLEAFKKLVM